MSFTLPPPAISLLEPHSDARRVVVFWSHITRPAVISPPPFLSWVRSLPPYPPYCFIGVHVINCWAVSAQLCIIFSTPGIFFFCDQCIVYQWEGILPRWSVTGIGFSIIILLKNWSWQAWYQSQADCRKPLGAIANRLLASLVLLQHFAIVAIFCWSS